MPSHVALPLAGAALAARRERRARTLLGLAAAPSRRRVGRLLALAAVPLLLALAATQPVLSSTTSARVRTDAQAFFVVDISRSMDASKGPRQPTRFARAVKDAIALRAAIPTIPSGIATLTDRVLPSLFPNPDSSVFDNTMTHAVSLEQPPPDNDNVVATSLDALGALGTENFFPATVKKRLVVVLTDGESRPFDAGQIAHALGSGPGVQVVFVHVWADGEAVFDGAHAEQGYRELPTSGLMLATLANAIPGAAVYDEGALHAAALRERVDLGAGPSVSEGRLVRRHSLAPFVALLALVPLAAAFVRRPALRRGSRAARPSAIGAKASLRSREGW